MIFGYRLIHKKELNGLLEHYGEVCYGIGKLSGQKMATMNQRDMLSRQLDKIVRDKCKD